MKSFIRFLAVAFLLAGAVVLMGAQINSSARCQTGADCNIGNGSPSGITLDTSGADANVNGTSNTFTVTATSTNDATFTGADAAGAANTVYDTTGAGYVQVGSTDVTGVYLYTDGGWLQADDTTNTLEWRASASNTAVISGADLAGAANTTFDTTGAGAIDVGSADVLTVDIVTDGGTATHDGPGSVIQIGSGSDPGATCTVGTIYLDTDETVDTNCTTTADNSLCLCTATDTWTALENN